MSISLQPFSVIGSFILNSMMMRNKNAQQKRGLLFQNGPGNIGNNSIVRLTSSMGVALSDCFPAIAPVEATDKLHQRPLRSFIRCYKLITTPSAVPQTTTPTPLTPNAPKTLPPTPL